MDYYIGIDGGGTKAAFCLYDGTNKYYNRIEGGVNPNEVGFEISAERIANGIELTAVKFGFNPVDCVSAFAGIAGATARGYKELLCDFLRKRFPKAKISASHDGENILYAGFGDGDGTIIISGTGCCAFAKSNGVIHRIGGYLTFDLDGSGYEIGKKAVAYALMAYDGRKERSSLTTRIEELAGGNIIENLTSLLQAPRSRLASFSPAVIEEAERGNEDAVDIIESAAKYLAHHTHAAAKYYSGKFGVVVSGGAGQNKYFFDKICLYADKNAEMRVLKTKPVDGALYRAVTQTEDTF